MASRMLVEAGVTETEPCPDDGLPGEEAFQPGRVETVARGPCLENPGLICSAPWAMCVATVAGRTSPPGPRLQCSRTQGGPGAGPITRESTRSFLCAVHGARQTSYEAGDGATELNTFHQVSGSLRTPVLCWTPWRVNHAAPGREWLVMGTQACPVRKF